MTSDPRFTFDNPVVGKVGDPCLFCRERPSTAYGVAFCEVCCPPPSQLFTRRLFARIRRLLRWRIARDWPEDFAHENGRYQNSCAVCGEIFHGYKRRVVCRRCA